MSSDWLLRRWPSDRDLRGWRGIRNLVNLIGCGVGLIIGRVLMRRLR